MREKITKLFEKAKHLNYDDYCGMIAVDHMKGAGFFPGCFGVHDLNSIDTKKFIMIVGQDFDTEKNYCGLSEEGEVNSNKTWRNLKILLNDIGICEADCFFTNAYMGLRKNANKNTGPTPAKKSKAFVKECECFFKQQLSIINPNTVIVLGIEPAKFLIRISNEDFKNWKEISPLKKFYKDENKGSFACRSVCNGKTINFLFALHPSLNIPNRAKIWNNCAQQETAILKEHLKSFKSNSSLK